MKLRIANTLHGSLSLLTIACLSGLAFTAPAADPYKSPTPPANNTPPLSRETPVNDRTLKDQNNNDTMDEKTERGQFSASDFKFVKETAHGGMMEVEVGKLAQQKAENQSVRDFAKRMVEDHTKANESLKQLVSQKGATLTAMGTKASEKTIDSLRDKSGADFDKAYVKMMVSGHDKTVKAFENAAEKSDDADLKNWVAKTLPTLQEHQRMIHTLDTSVNGTKTETLP